MGFVITMLLDMTTKPKGKHLSALACWAFLILLLAWLPMALEKLEGPNECMYLGMLLAMVWLCGLSLAGAGLSLFAVGRAENRGHPIAVPVVFALLNLAGFFISLWWFF
jgi:hypothetical protein